MVSKNLMALILGCMCLTLPVRAVGEEQPEALQSASRWIHEPLGVDISPANIKAAREAYSAYQEAQRTLERVVQEAKIEGDGESALLEFQFYEVLRHSGEQEAEAEATARMEAATLRWEQNTEARDTRVKQAVANRETAEQEVLRAIQQALGGDVAAEWSPLYKEVDRRWHTVAQAITESVVGEEGVEVQLSTYMKEAREGAFEGAALITALWEKDTKQQRAERYQQEVVSFLQAAQSDTFSKQHDLERVYYTWVAPLREALQKIDALQILLNDLQDLPKEDVQKRTHEFLDRIRPFQLRDFDRFFRTPVVMGPAALKYAREACEAVKDAQLTLERVIEGTTIERQVEAAAIDFQTWRVLSCEPAEETAEEVTARNQAFEAEMKALGEKMNARDARVKAANDAKDEAQHRAARALYRTLWSGEGYKATLLDIHQDIKARQERIKRQIVDHAMALREQHSEYAPDIRKDAIEAAALMVGLERGEQEWTEERVQARFQDQKEGFLRAAESDSRRNLQDLWFQHMAEREPLVAQLHQLDEVFGLLLELTESGPALSKMVTERRQITSDFLERTRSLLEPSTL